MIVKYIKPQRIIPHPPATATLLALGALTRKVTRRLGWILGYSLPRTLEGAGC